MANLIHSMHQETTYKTNQNHALALLIAIAFWLLTRPYRGIWHDGIFYAAQALKHLYPEQYANDIFFLYGSQDDYTLFGAIQSWLTGLLGMEQTFFLLTVVGAAFWIVALLRLLSRWFSYLSLFATLILVLCADSHYGGFHVLSFGEGFATPRIFAEALVLFSLALWLEGRKLAVILALLAASLIHPIISLAGIGVVGWSFLSAQRIRPVVLWWVLFGLGLLGLQLLLWTGLSPQLDPLWRQHIELRNPLVMPNLWNLSDWLGILLDATLLWLAWRFVQNEAGKLAGWTLAVFVLAVLCSLAAILMDVQLVVAAQPHRVQWLAHLLALALVVPVCMHLWANNKTWDRCLAAAVASSVVLPFNLGGLVLLTLYGLYVWVNYRLPERRPPREVVTVFLVGVPLSALVLWLFNVAVYLGIGNWMVLGNPRAWLLTFIQPAVAFLIFFLAYALSLRLRLGPSGLWAYGLCLLIVGIVNWDVREPWLIYSQPEREAAIAPVKAMIPEDAVVYWESAEFLTENQKRELDSGVNRSWLWLQRSNYASSAQGAGNIFYRQTAIELARRIDHLQQWGYRDGSLVWITRHELPHKIALTQARLEGVCGDPILDFVITDTKLPSASLNFQDPLTGRKYSVYDCQMMRHS